MFSVDQVVPLLSDVSPLCYWLCSLSKFFKSQHVLFVALFYLNCCDLLNIPLDQVALIPPSCVAGCVLRNPNSWCLLLSALHQLVRSIAVRHSQAAVGKAPWFSQRQNLAFIQLNTRGVLHTSNFITERWSDVVIR